MKRNLKKNKISLHSNNNCNNLATKHVVVFSDSLISNRKAMNSKHEALKRKRIKSDEASSDSDSDTEQKKPLCKYGEKCYQKNLNHIQKFRHPHRDNVVVNLSPKLEVTISQKKKT